MIALSIIVILVIVVSTWLGMHKRWKTLIGVIASFMIIFIAAWFFSLRIISKAFVAKCEINREWKIENYQIVERQCIGFSGPYYYPVYLYEDNKEIDRLSYLDDSTCNVQFISKDGDTLRFNICEMVVTRNKK